MGTLFAVAILMIGFNSNHAISVVIPLQKMEDCQYIQNQMRKAYGHQLRNFDCFGDVK